MTRIFCILLVFIAGNALLQAAPRHLQDEEKIDRREGKIIEIDATKQTLIVELNDDQFKLTVEIGSATELVCARTKIKVADLKVGMLAAVHYKPESKTPFKVDAAWPRVDITPKAIDPAKRTITISIDGEKGIDVDAVLNVRPDAEVLFDGIFAGLEDVPLQRTVSIELAADKKTVAGIHAPGDEGDTPAILKKLDRTSLVVTLVANNSKAERQVDLGFGLGDVVKVRLAGKTVDISELKPEMPVVVRLALDRRTVTHIWAAYPDPKKEDK